MEEEELEEEEEEEEKEEEEEEEDEEEEEESAATAAERSALGQNRETLTSRDRAPAGYAGKGDLMQTREYIATVSVGFKVNAEKKTCASPSWPAPPDRRPSPGEIERCGLDLSASLSSLVSVLL